MIEHLRLISKATEKAFKENVIKRLSAKKCVSCLKKFVGRGQFVV
jgi:hypothetical protein